MTKDNEGFSTRVNQFVEELMKHPDVISVETFGNETLIMYEDWSEHPPIINTRIKVFDGRMQSAKVMSGKLNRRII